MTEVPEHLLARAKQARARAEGGSAEGDAAPAEEASAATPVPTASSAPAPASPAATTPAVPAAPEPVAPYVEAARRRKKMPVWAVPILLMLPIWAIFYVGTLEPPTTEEEGLLAVGGEVYAAQCASCHGGAGGGGVGRQLNGGEVLLTFPSLGSADYEGSFDGLAAMISWIANGTDGTRQFAQVVGDPDRPGGAHAVGSFGNMGGFASLSPEQLLGVAFYERVTHGGLDEAAAESEEAVLEALLESPELALDSGVTPEQVAEQLAVAREELGVEGGGEAAAG